MLSVGLLLNVLACVIWQSWWPIFVGALFLPFFRSATCRYTSQTFLNVTFLSYRLFLGSDPQLALRWLQSRLRRSIRQVRFSLFTGSPGRLLDELPFFL